MNNVDSILFGIISGLLTGFIAFGFSQVIQKIVLPWYLNLIYDGYNVEGTWKVMEGEPNLRRDITFTLQQKAGLVTGISTHVLKDKNQDGDYIKTYTLKGELKERFLTLTSRHVDRQRIGVGTVMIEIIGDGQKMEGCIAAYSSTVSRIVSFRCTAARINVK